MEQPCRICETGRCNEAFTVKEMMFGTKEEYLYLRCDTCGTVQIKDPVHDPSRLYPQRYYSFKGSGKDSLKESVNRTINKFVTGQEVGKSSVVGRLLRKFRQSPDARSLRNIISRDSHILDVGCGSGQLIGALYDLGHRNVAGIDPFIDSDIVKGFVIQKKFLSEFTSDSKFDVIMLHHSFEHMEEPLAVLRKVKDLLKDDGVCIIRIPVSDSTAFDIYQQHWFQLDAPRHVHLFTNKSIELLSGKAGFKVENIDDDSGPTQLIISEQYKRGIPLNDERSFLTPFFKRLNPFRKRTFSTAEIKSFSDRFKQIVKQKKGDQRVYYLRHLSYNG